MVRLHLVVDEQPMMTQKRIKRWAKKNGYKILRYQGGFIKIQVSKGYSRTMVIIYILTLWIGAIIHRLLRMEHGKLYILLNPYGPGTFLTLKWKGADSAKAVKDLKKEIKAKTARHSKYYF
jgi:hypothetical protein